MLVASGFSRLAYAIYTTDGRTKLHVMTQVEVWADSTKQKKWNSMASYYSHDGSLIYGSDSRKDHTGLHTLGRFLCNDTLLVSEEIELLMYLGSLKKDDSVQAVVRCFYDYGLITQNSRFLRSLREGKYSDVIKTIKGADIAKTEGNIIRAIIGANDHIGHVVVDLAAELARKVHESPSSFGKVRNSHKRGMRVFV